MKITSWVSDPISIDPPLKKNEAFVVHFEGSDFEIRRQIEEALVHYTAEPDQVIIIDSIPNFVEFKTHKGQYPLKGLELADIKITEDYLEQQRKRTQNRNKSMHLKRKKGRG